MPATIHIVDDDPSVRRSLARLLQSLGYSSVEYASVDALLAADTLPRGGCVVADVTMRGRRGTDLPLELQRRGIDVPVILVTAHDRDEVRVEAKRSGASAYLRKPVDEQALVDAIEWALSTQGAPPSSRSR